MIIGFTGAKGSGKTTISNFLIRECGFIRYKFSAPLKCMISCLGLDPDQLEERTKESPIPGLGGYTPRRLMQTLGTDWGRNMINQDLWVWLLRNRIEKNHGWDNVENHAVNVVVDDVRFTNEVGLIVHHKGLIYGVERPDVLADSHASEHSLHGFKPIKTFVNSGTIPELEEQIFRYFSQQTFVTFPPKG